MQCLRCGRETNGDQAFCFLCESVMVKQPVKPNTVVTIPMRTTRVHSAPVRKPAKQEEDTAPLHRTILQLRLWLCMLMALLMLCVGVLTWQELSRSDEPAIGQNYTSIVEFGGGGR